jgi:tripartite-type tricarboxylate transporter receptor subunit TctC
MTQWPAALVVLAATAAFAASSHAQTTTAWPTKPVRWIVPYAPGGAVDMVSRVIAPKLTERMGQPVIVENRPGAASNIGAEMVARAAPDGYTVLYTAPAIVTNPFFFAGSPDTSRFAPVIHVVSTSFVLLSSTSFAAKTVAEIVAQARAKPGTVSCGSPGGLSTVGCELLRSHVKADLIMVMYKGNAPALNGIMSGELDLMFDVASAAVGPVKGGRARAVASLSPRRGTPLFADLPTVSETIPGFELVTWHGVVAPKATPRELLHRLNQHIDGTLREPEVRTRLVEAGFEIRGGPVDNFEEVIRRETVKYGKVLKEAGIKPQ